MQIPRPPIVVILGHVDHGKTTLLDYLRKSSIAAGETGGITQAIRSFQLKTESLKLMTFIDTPGHAAFTAMRSRGSEIADIAILVISAVDGVMPQTRESIEFIKAAGIPFVVVLNKSDLPDSNPDKVKTQLTEANVIVEDFGGKIPAVSISAKTGQGLPELLEMLELLVSLHPPQSDPDLPATAVVLESRLDSQKGPLATVIVKNGTLRVGSAIYQAQVIGKARALIDSDGQNIKQAPPSTPVEILGLNTVPVVGSLISAAPMFPTKVPPLESRGDAGGVTESSGLNIILRADVAGSLEAILNALPPTVTVLSSGTGDITETNISTAKSGAGIVVGFNVKAPASVSKLAEVEKVSIYSFKIIYELLEQIDKLIVQPVVENILGRAQIIAQFKINTDRIAGCKCTEGVINKSHKIKIMRGDILVGETRIKSLKSRKSNVITVKSGLEFGAVFSPYIDFKPGDLIIAVEV